MMKEPEVKMPEKWGVQRERQGESTAKWLQSARDRRCFVVVPDRDGFPVLEGPDFSYQPDSPADLAEFLFEGGGRWLTVSKFHEMQSLWKLFPPKFCKDIQGYRPGKGVQWLKHDGYYWESVGREDSLCVMRGATTRAYVSNVEGMMPDTFDRTPPGITQWGERFFGAASKFKIPNIGTVISRGNVGRAIMDNISPRALTYLGESERFGQYRPDVLHKALQVDKGGRTELFRCGTIDKAWQYDIPQAYAAAAQNVKCICERCCRWIEGTEFQESADYGFALCYVVQPFRKVCIGSYRARISRHVDSGYGLLWPYGRFPVWLGIDTIRVYREAGYEIKIFDGIWGFCNDRHSPPFKATVDRIFAMTAANPDIAFSFKAARNAMLGSLRSIHDGVAGSHCNPIYSAKIKDMVRARITRLALEYEDSLIRISTDGMALDKPVKDSHLSNEPGGLKLEGVDSTTGLTDFFTDRPGKAPRWRQCLEDAPPDATSFTVSITAYHGLGNFAIPKVSAQEAWERLGKAEPMNWPVPLGSTVRDCDKSATVRDYLTGEIPTVPMHIEEIQEAQWIQSMEDWIGSIVDQ